MHLFYRLSTIDLCLRVFKTIAVPSPSIRPWSLSVKEREWGFSKSNSHGWVCLWLHLNVSISPFSSSAALLDFAATYKRNINAINSFRADILRLLTKKKIYQKQKLFVKWIRLEISFRIFLLLFLFKVSLYFTFDRFFFHFQWLKAWLI